MHRKTVLDNRRTSLSVQVAVAVPVAVAVAAVLIAFIGASFATFTAYQFSALVHLTEQINLAGRLHVLSQHAALPLLTSTKN